MVLPNQKANPIINQEKRKIPKHKKMALTSLGLYHRKTKETAIDLSHLLANFQRNDGF